MQYRSCLIFSCGIEIASVQLAVKLGWPSIPSPLLGILGIHVLALAQLAVSSWESLEMLPPAAVLGTRRGNEMWNLYSPLYRSPFQQT